jgi:hypothetical protein
MESADLERILGTEPLSKIKTLSLSSKIAALRNISEQMPNGPDLAILQHHIVELMSEQRSHLDSAVPVLPPNAYDVLITDITSEDLNRIAYELQSIALTETTTNPIFPVHGIIYGPNHRIFVPLVVSKRSKTINVNFLFDCGSPNTYLRSETLSALGFKDSIPIDTIVAIHGTAITVYPATNHFENVDLLGQDYLAAIRGLVMINYPLKQIEIRMI